MSFKLILSLLALTIASDTLCAQKLPKVQETGLRVPANVKIDGKPTEWNKFQAYNTTTGLYYTIANDDEKLYLAVQAKDQTVIKRMLGGGITLSIQRSTDKKDKNKISITYPMLADPKARSFSINLGHATRTGTADPMTHTITYTKLDVDTSVEARNTTMNMHNNLIAQKLKWIGVQGIKGVDTLSSIYNENNIKVSGLFDNREIYTFEMFIPLKYLNLPANGKFTYHLQVDGIKGQDTIFDGVPESVLQSPAISQLIAQQAASTDFWGEYTLVK